MHQDSDWTRLVTRSENKSRGIAAGRGIRLSSIDGWTYDHLPKLLIVWSFEKTSSDRFPSRSRPGRFSKKRDLTARVSEYELFLVTADDNCIVPWEETPSHQDLVHLRWTDDWLEDLKEKVQRLNEKYRGRPIIFQRSFKNGRYLRLQYEVLDYSQLPNCPTSVSKLIAPHLNELVGAEFRLKKDHSAIGGPRGWYDNEMAQWEHENDLKSPGTLHVRRVGGEWEPYPDFSEGRQDYWSGFAIDFLMAEVTPGFEDKGGHATGSDHTLELSSLRADAADGEADLRE